MLFVSSRLYVNYNNEVLFLSKEVPGVFRDGLSQCRFKIQSDAITYLGIVIPQEISVIETLVLLLPKLKGNSLAWTGANRSKCSVLFI